jgi:hypothetical protein
LTAANTCLNRFPAGNANAAQRFVFDADQGALGGGVMVRTYLNKFSMAGPKVLDIRVHPNMPAGALLMTSRTLPYPPSNGGNVVQVRARQDYYQIEWPPRRAATRPASTPTRCCSTISRRPWR